MNPPTDSPARARRGRVSAGVLVAIAGVLAVLAAIFVGPAQADTLLGQAGGTGKMILDLPVSSGAAIFSSSLIPPASHPSCIYEVEVTLRDGESATLWKRINYGDVTEAAPNGTTTLRGVLNSGTALEGPNVYTFAVTGERLDQEGRVCSYNFDLEGTTPVILKMTVRRREVAH